MNEKIKIALILKNVNELYEEYPGATRGGGSVVNQNLYKELLLMQNVFVDIYTYTPAKNITQPTNVNIIEIHKLITPYDKQKLIDYIDSQNYSNVITIHPADIFRGRLLQSHSLLHRIKNSQPGIKIFKYIFLQKKIYNTKKIYTNLNPKDTFIAVSNKIKDDYSENFNIPPSQIKVAYPGCKRIYSTPPQIIEKEIPTFGIVANSAFNKGGHLFIAAAGIANTILNKKFKIIMIAPKFETDIFMKLLVRIYKLQDKITILPKQKDMEKFYTNIDYLVLPSKNEAFGLVVLEAMSFGKPVLVSQTAGSREIVTHNNGFIFNRNSFSDLVKNIIYLTKLYYNDFGRYKDLSIDAYNTSLKYSWKHFIEQILEEKQE